MIDKPRQRIIPRCVGTTHDSLSVLIEDGFLARRDCFAFCDYRCNRSGTSLEREMPNTITSLRSAHVLAQVALLATLACILVIMALVDNLCQRALMFCYDKVEFRLCYFSHMCID
jgi:hypothetical protein